MPGAFNPEEFRRHLDGLTLVSVYNQQRKNRLGASRNGSLIEAREARRRARQYEIAEIGWRAYLKKQLSKKKIEA